MEPPMRDAINTFLTDVADNLHKFQVFRRGVIVYYMIGGWQIAEWFMGLGAPSNAQSTFVSVYAGALPVLLGAYGYSRPKT